jgi:hypothetical protein
MSRIFNVEYRRDCSAMQTIQYKLRKQNNKKNESVHKKTKHTTRRHMISRDACIPPKEKKKMLDQDMKNEDFLKKSRYTVYMFGTTDSIKRILKSLVNVYNCKIFGSETRDGCWEAYLRIDRSKYELPCRAQLLWYIQRMGGNAIVETLSDIIDNQIVSFVCRICKYSVSFGSFPQGMRSRVREYERKLLKEEEEELVEQMLGMPVSAESMIILANRINELQTSLQTGENT